ncbi:DALR anticodon-binding domain-containing protein [Streptomyces coeruleorubidus]|uniref:ArgS-related anticodon-binding protein NrtL n=1 Tax=Streptomyces coeruleorubidus TaxID=116188 RepID=UPI00237EF599|nr:DALR anticodon-binding domain-containing protein [Streptomyces coeruleorubidus]WDV54571.1 DALR anticodon-binding domain-containing protein [Streptomyces coeruleorubidus]
MTPVELSRTVLHAVRRAVDEGELSVTVPKRAVVTPPGPGGCGDYATNIALQLAGAAGQPPRRVAEILRSRLAGETSIADVVVTGPGFLNFSLERNASALLVEEVLRRGRRYGHAEGFSGTVVQLRCPAEVRAVVVTDAVARVLRSQGDFVRVMCEGRPAPEWETVLGGESSHSGSRSGSHSGSRSGSHPRSHSAGPGTLPDLDVTVRPVPASSDPLPLGRDAARWALLYPAARDRPRIPGDHLVQRETNPLFRVRYAHARTRALLRNAADLGFHPEPGPVSDAEALLAALGDHPRVLTTAAAHRSPDRLARHLVTVADATLPLLPAVLPLGDEKPSAAHRARLALAEAAGAVLAGGLSLLGIDAPDHL